MAVNNPKICVRFICGDELFLDPEVTVNQLKVAVAKHIERFAPEVSAYCFSTGRCLKDDIYSNGQTLPPIVLAVINGLDYDDDAVWKQVIRVHAYAGDVDGISRAKRAMKGISTQKSFDTIVNQTLMDELRLSARAPGSEHLPAFTTTLLEAGASVKYEDKYKWTTLMLASCHGHEQVVSTLVCAGASIRSAADGGWTSLILASCNGQLPVVCFLLARGADANDATRSGWTSLLFAARRGHEGLVHVLLDARARVDVKNINGETALYWAAREGMRAIVDRLLDESDEEKIRAIVDQPETSDGWTSLHWASRSGHELIVQRLLAAQATVDFRDRAGCTSLFWAARTGHLPVAQTLLDAHASVEAEDIAGFTSLHSASRMGHVPMIDLLLKYSDKDGGCHRRQDGGRTSYSTSTPNVVVNRESRGGSTCLYLASMEGHCEAVDRLIRAEADVNHIKNGNVRETSLLVAAQRGHFQVVKRLLEAGAQWEVRNESGQTAEECAREEGYWEIERILAHKREEAESD